MNVLITGGNGFIASHVITALSAAGHTITTICRNDLTGDRLQPSVKKLVASYGDLAVLAGVLPATDVVIHLGWSSVPKEGLGFIAAEINSDVIESVNLFNACVKHGVKKIIFISSGGTVYGFPKQIPISEAHATDPVSSYGICKLAVEKYLQLYHRLGNMNYTILRISNAYGENQNMRKGQGVIGHWMEKILKNEQIEIWGDGTVVRDYIHISDIVRVILIAVSGNELNNDIYNLASGNGNSLNDILNIFKTLVPQINVQYKDTRKVDVDVNVLDITKIQQKINFQTAVSLKEGITMIWNSVNR